LRAAAAAQAVLQLDVVSLFIGTSQGQNKRRTWKAGLCGGGGDEGGQSSGKGSWELATPKDQQVNADRTATGGQVA